MSSTKRGSVTKTVRSSHDRTEQPMYELRLRPHVNWTEDTIDNEHMNKKRSKKCCIFHKHTEFGESSPECSSESDWVDSSDIDN